MAKDETKRVSPKQLQEDKDVLAAIRKMTGYTPGNKDYEATKFEAQEDALGQAQEDERDAEAKAGTARDVACAVEWNFHNYVLEAKNQVKAVYGENSTQVQEVGLKRKSERARPGRKNKQPSTPPPANPPTP